MAYFANGTEGDILDNQCGDCLLGDDLAIFCPIAGVQAEYNYKQCENSELAAAMNRLVDEKGKCLMKPMIEKFCEGQCIS